MADPNRDCESTSRESDRRRFLKAGVAFGATLAGAARPAPGGAQPAPDDPSKVLGGPVRPYGERSRFEQAVRMRATPSKTDEVAVGNSTPLDETLGIPTDGEGLPTGSGTAALGEPIYAVRCASCHGERGQNPKYDRLVGGHGSLKTDTPVLTIGSFWPYATTLWSYIRRSQPVDEPGSLTLDQVYAVTAYLLYLNGIIGEQEVLDARSLPTVRMPNRDGFVTDPRPDVGPTRKRAPR